MISRGPLEDRLSIRELVESYNDAVMRFDADAWGANWAEDATWDTGQGPHQGREAIVAAWLEAMSRFSFVGFFASAGPIVVEGDTAHATWYQQEFLHPKEGDKIGITGRYEDDYVKLDGRWYFKQRLYQVMNMEVG
jgi:ketosteroid isomerase-like protein